MSKGGEKVLCFVIESAHHMVWRNAVSEHCDNRKTLTSQLRSVVVVVVVGRGGAEAGSVWLVLSVVAYEFEPSALAMALASAAALM